MREREHSKKTKKNLVGKSSGARLTRRASQKKVLGEKGPPAHKVPPDFENGISDEAIAKMIYEGGPIF